MPRFLRVCLVLACLPAASLTGATNTEKSRASQKLLAAYRQDDPAGVGREALALAEKGNPEAQFIAGLLQDIGAGLAIDHDSARGWLEKAAAQKHDGAMLMLAWKAQTGFGLPRADPAEAARRRAQAGPVADDAFAPWLRKGADGFEPDLSRAFLWMIDAADGGSVPAMRNLAECYLLEYWTTPSATDHVRWLERASAAGNFESMVVLSVYCEAGTLVPADAAMALALRRRAAEGGYPLGQFVLAGQYEQGRGVPQDFPAALQWYNKAAKQDHVPSILRLIELRRNGVRDIPQDFKEAVRLAERGRKLGDAACIRNLADLYNRGEGVTRDLPRSVKLYEEAAAMADGPALTMLGWIRHHGQDGKTDYAAAHRWYNQAAELGQVRAMLELGEMNEQGLGVGPNPSVAFAWYERAGRLGDVGAQEKLGSMLLQGRGMPKDPEEAVSWFRFADSRGFLDPRWRDWRKAGDLADAVTGLLAVAREEKDPWLEANLVWAVQLDPKRQPELQQQVLRALDDPDLLAIPGILPEACLSVLEASAELREQADRLFQRLLAADRIQSAWWLGLHALEGKFMRRDLDRAAQWAKVVSADLPGRGAVLTALVQTEAAADPAQRDQAWDTLWKFAVDGEPVANLAIARRVLAGQGSSRDRRLVDFRQKNTATYARVMGQPDLADQLESRQPTLAGSAPGPEQTPAGPSDAELALRIEQAVKARKRGGDYQPQPLARFAPAYPYELRKDNISGSVVVEFVINEQGRTQDFRVVRSTDRRFEPAAVAAVSRWLFVPGWKEGRTVRIRVAQLLEFNAGDDLPKEKK